MHVRAREPDCTREQLWVRDATRYPAVSVPTPTPDLNEWSGRRPREMPPLLQAAPRRERRSTPSTHGSKRIGCDVLGVLSWERCVEVCFNEARTDAWCAGIP